MTIAAIREQIHPPEGMLVPGARPVISVEDIDRLLAVAEAALVKHPGWRSSPGGLVLEDAAGNRICICGEVNCRDRVALDALEAAP